MNISASKPKVTQSDTSDKTNGQNTIWSLPAGAPFESEVRFVAKGISAFIEWLVSE